MDDHVTRIEEVDAELNLEGEEEKLKQTMKDEKEGQKK